MRAAFAQIMGTMSDEDRFERGLERLLDGIALHVARTPAVRSRSGPG